MAEFSFTYRAFISYAHADHKWAVWLHRALERYRVPRRIAGAKGLRRLGKVFRDEEELAAAAELGPKIDAALRTSDVLIVVCSPRSAKSKWVNQEIEAFKRLGRAHRVLALIVDGEPHGAPDVAGETTECFPEALKYNPDSSVAEPLAVDVRKFGREDAILRVVAGLLDVGYDDLRQREVRRRRAERRFAEALFAAGLVLIAGALTGGYFAATNYVDARELRSKQFASLSLELTADGDRTAAMRAALAADPSARGGPLESWLRPNGFPDAQRALEQAWGMNEIERVLRHNVPVTFMALTLSDTHVIVAYENGDLKLWRVSDGKEIWSTKAHDAAPMSLAASADGKWLATADGGCRDEKSSCAVVLRRVSDGGIEKDFSHDDYVISLAFSPQSSVLASGSDDGVLRFWSTGTLAVRVIGAAETSPNAKLVDEGLGGRVSSLAFDDTGRRIIASTGFGAILFDVEAAVISRPAEVAGGESVPYQLNLRISEGRRFESDRPIRAVAFDLPRGRFVTADLTGVVAFWPINRDLGDKPPTMISMASEPVVSLAFPPVFDESNPWAVATASGGWLKSDDGTRTATYGDHLGGITAVLITKDAERVLTAGADGKVKLRRTRGALPEATYDESNGDPAQFTPTGGIVSASGENGVMTWLRVREAPAKTVGWESDEVVPFLADDGQFVAAEVEGVIRIQNTSDGTVVAEFKEPDSVPGLEATRMTFSADNALMATYVPVKNSAVKIWRIVDQSLIQRIEFSGGSVAAVAFSRDGRKLAIGSEFGLIELWPVGSERYERTFVARGRVTSIAFAPDGTRLVAAVDGVARLWRVGEDEPVQTFERAGDTFIDSVAFSPDGELIATGSDKGEVTLWRAGQSAPIQVFDGRGDNNVHPLAFSRDGTRLLSSSRTRASRVWRIDPFFSLPVDGQTQQACKRLKNLGESEFNARDRLQHIIIREILPDPCDPTKEAANNYAAAIRDWLNEEPPSE